VIDQSEKGGEDIASRMSGYSKTAGESSDSSVDLPLNEGTAEKRTDDSSKYSEQRKSGD
jgi:hypothetical protein